MIALHHLLAQLTLCLQLAPGQTFFPAFLSACRPACLPACLPACRLAFPAWGVTWDALPVDGGWGPFLGAAAVMIVFYPLVLVALRVIRRGDLELLQELAPGRRE